MMWSALYLELKVINGSFLSICVLARHTCAFAASEKFERISFLTSSSEVSDGKSLKTL